MKALFITLKEIKRKSIIDGNLDSDKIIQFIEVAQDTYIQTQLGTKLYDQLQYEIINDSVTSVNQTLIDDYLKPMLIWYSQATLIPFIAFQISNGGVYKHRSENADVASLDEIDSLVNDAKIQAEFYTQRFIDFMNENSSDYPLYTTNQDGGMYPERDQNLTGWVL